MGRLDGKGKKGTRYKFILVVLTFSMMLLLVGLSTVGYVYYTREGATTTTSSTTTTSTTTSTSSSTTTLWTTTTMMTSTTTSTTTTSTIPEPIICGGINQRICPNNTCDRGLKPSTTGRCVPMKGGAGPNPFLDRWS